MCCRLLTSKQQEAREPKQKRPYLATEVHDVVEADKWRQQILREIGRKVMEIQNAGLGEHRYDLASSPLAVLQDTHPQALLASASPASAWCALSLF